MLYVKAWLKREVALIAKSVNSSPFMVVKIGIYWNLEHN